MIRIRASLLAVVGPAVTAVAASGQEELESGVALGIELLPDDPPLEGRGPSKDLCYRVKSDGCIYVYAWSRECDPGLVIESAGGDVLAEDGDSGGGTTAFLEREVHAGEELWVRVANARAEQGGAVEVRLTEIAKLAAEHRPALEAAAKLVRESNAALAARAWAEARTRARASVDALLSIPSPPSREVADALIDASVASWNAQEAPGLARASERLLDFRVATLPETHLDLLGARSNLAHAKRALGDLRGALRLFETNLEVCERTLPETHVRFLDARRSVAGAKRELGESKAALELFRKVFEVSSRTLPDDHRDLQIARSNLAGSLVEVGDLRGARELLEKTEQVLARTMREDDPERQSARMNLALVRWELGDLRGALDLQERACDALSRNVPDDHPDLQAARANLAIFKSALGDQRAALDIMESVLEVRSRTLPPDHPDLQAARQNVALSRIGLGDVEGASEIQETILAMAERSLPDDHPVLQTTRSNLANTRRILGDFRGAQELFEKVLEVRSKTLPDDHPDLQLARQNLAAVKHGLGDLDRARDLAEKVLEVRKLTLPEDHPALADARSGLSIVLASLGESARCEELLRELADGSVAAISGFGLALAPRELAELAASQARALSWLLSRAAESGGRLDAAAFRWVEAARAVEVHALTLGKLARAAADPGQLAELESEVFRRGAEVARAGRSDPAAFQFATEAKEKAQRELQVWLAGLPQVRSRISDPRPETMARALREDEAAVGYWRYRRCDVVQPRAEPVDRGDHYVAFVVRRDAALARVDLGPAGAIDDVIDAWRERIGSLVARGASAVAGGPDPEVEAGARVRRLVLDPLLPHLSGATRLAVALDDALHLLPLDALPAEGGGRVGDSRLVAQRATLRELLEPGEAPAGEPTLVAFGAVDYDAAPGAGGGLAAEIVRSAPSWLRAFTELPSTGPEAEAVAGYFAKSHRDAPAPAILRGAAATRSAFLELAPRARFLHLATHGYFAPESIPSLADEKRRTEREVAVPYFTHEQRVSGFAPMILCGLAFAGANLPPDERGAIRGILTAEELALLDLSGCELAVLSACETNVGRRRAGQGIASLQQALHAAGVRTAVTSLWRVPDEATRELMADFYRRIWTLRTPRAQALWEAKRQLRRQERPDGSPRYGVRDWAAWVLSGSSD